ncbi:MAG: hypothetical protein RL590_1154, partial [Actinomycetota bacterium]
MSMPPLPQNFGRAFDLSSLAKPTIKEATQGQAKEATVENFMSDFVSLSAEKPVVLLAYSPRSQASIELRDLMADMSKTDNESWIFGGINADTQPQLAQALQIPSV